MLAASVPPAALIASGDLKPAVIKILMLAVATQAHELSEPGHERPWALNASSLFTG